MILSAVCRCTTAVQQTGHLKGGSLKAPPNRSIGSSKGGEKVASLRQNKQGEDIVCFRLSGRQYNRALGTDDEKEAAARLKRVEATLHDLGTGRLALPEGCQDVGLFVMSDGKAAAKLVMPKTVTVQAVIDRFLADAEVRVSEECFRQYRKHLLRFVRHFGNRPAEGLTAAEAEAYTRRPKWSSSYRNGILGSLVSAFRWAERNKVIAHNPLTGIRKPPKASRGKKALVSLETHAALCEHADPFFRSFLQLLWYTGCRPGEVAALTAENLDLIQGVAVLSEHKTAHLGKSRVIFLCPKAVVILRERIALHPDGLLFPGEDGERLTAQAIGCRLRRLCVKAGVTHCIPYGYRHGYATQALLRGVPDAKVTALLGHSGTAQLHRHYAHLTAHAQALREEAGKVRAG